jgi:hypothetical protein
MLIFQAICCPYEFISCPEEYLLGSLLNIGKWMTRLVRYNGTRFCFLFNPARNTFYILKVFGG